MTDSKLRKPISPDERIWKDRYIDKNLSDEWMEKLNQLNHFSLISICEGHATGSKSSSRSYPHINLRLKSKYIHQASSMWQDVKSLLYKELINNFSSELASVTMELKLRYSNQEGSSYSEDLSVRINSLTQRNSETFNEQTRQWFELIISRIELFDKAVRNIID